MKYINNVLYLFKYARYLAKRLVWQAQTLLRQVDDSSMPVLRKGIKPISSIIFIAFVLSALFGWRVYFRTDKSNLVNTTIVKARGAYAYKNTTNAFHTQFKANPTDAKSIVFSNKLGNISFYTPAEQTFGTISSTASPVTDGSILAYPAIFPGIDLRYTISSTRLLEEFIVQDAATAGQIDRIEQRAQTKSTYVVNDDGSITFSNKDKKEVFTLPHPVMYETGNTGVKSEGIVYEITKDQNQLIITKVITEEGRKWLADPKRVYPIAIDLVIDNADTSSDWVSSDTNTTVVSQEITIKQEGTGSVKVQTTANTTATFDLMEYSSDGTAQAAYVSNANFSATGGTITTFGNYTIHKFTSSGTFTPNVAGNVDILVVAGGGAGGNGSTGGPAGSGGGGAGGVINYTSQTLTGGANYTVTVGAGGASPGVGSNGGKGGNSQFGSLAAATGGGGGGYASLYGNGGNGGGSGGGGGWTAYEVDQTWGAGGTAGQGNGGGRGQWGNSLHGGGGGGKSAAGSDSGNGGAGYDYSASYGTNFGVNGVVAGGGGGGYTSTGGAGGGGNGTGSTGNPGTANTGGGGAGAYSSDGAGSGGSGVVVVRYPITPLLAYSEATIKTQGTYALKGIAQVTTSLNKTLTRTIGSPINLSNIKNVTFDLRASRTGSNIKVGLHDSGGTTTEVTPNITSANTFQSVTLDLSGVTNANKDAIDQIIITIVNADAANTFYLDNMMQVYNSINDTVTKTTSPTNLSNYTSLSYWVRSTVAGSYATFGFGESAATEQSTSITINSPNTWEKKTWDISGISNASKNAITKFAFTFTGETSGASFYFDDIQTTDLSAPTLGTPTPRSDTSIRWNFTDNSSYETGFKIYDASDNLIVTCNSSDITFCDETGLTPDTQYTRKIGTYNATNTSINSGTVSSYTLAATPLAPSVTNRLATTVSVNPNPATNPSGTLMAIYREENVQICDGSGGVYLAANGSSNGATAVWQDDASWGTLSATGLTEGSSYIFCVKAKNTVGTETAFGAPGGNESSGVPVSGDWIYTQGTTSIDRYTDGNNPLRSVIGVDSGGATETNNANSEIRSGILTLNATDTLVTGTMTLTGGSVAVASGAVIKLNTPVWVVDADADGYTADTKLYFGTQPPLGPRRKNLITSLSASDCNESFYAANNVCCTVATRYQDADGDGYGNPAVSISACTTAGYVDDNTDCNDGNISIYRAVAGYLDSDGDGYGTGAYATCVGASGSYVANATDCNDIGANAVNVSTPATCYTDADNDNYGVGTAKTCITAGATCSTATWASVGTGTASSGNFAANNTDCNDTGANSQNVWVSATCYADADNDDYGTGTAKSCTNNATCGSATWASGGAGTAAASGNFAANASDCYDANANAKPGSGVCSATNRGDGSFDYNCSGTNQVCGTQRYNSANVCIHATRPGAGCPCQQAGDIVTSAFGPGQCGAYGYSQGSYYFGGNSDCDPFVYLLGAFGTQACQ